METSMKKGLLLLLSITGLFIFITDYMNSLDEKPIAGKSIRVSADNCAAEYMDLVNDRLLVLKLLDGDHTAEIRNLDKLNLKDAIAFVNDTKRKYAMENVVDMQEFMLSGVKIAYLKGVSAGLSTVYDLLEKNHNGNDLRWSLVNEMCPNASRTNSFIANVN